MKIDSGTHLGPYQIISQVGKGGMGEVYKAVDTRLNRTVAIKTLHPRLSSLEAWRERFKREAQAIASLEHPHICVIHDVGHVEGVDFLVMEYLEGETLEKVLLSRGKLSFDEALQYAIQISDALDKAQRRGVTHRDLKPANVMITKSGVKLLDFGLAKLQLSGDSTLEMQATEQETLTKEGMVLGTPLYMAPEQSRGGQTDARSDIFSFGVVLYEMLAGRKAVDLLAGYAMVAAGPQTSVSMAAVASVPVLDSLIRTCLAPNPDDRWQYMADVLVALKRIKEDRPWLNTPVQGTRHTTKIPWAVAAILGLVAIVGLVGPSVWWPPQVVSTPLVRFELATPSQAASSDQLNISPDGRYIVEAIETDRGTSLWIRPLDQISGRVLPGTEAATYPFWAPDAKFIGFFADGKLKKVDTSGSAIQVLCPAPGGRGGTWSRNGTIIFGGESALYTVSDVGGTPKPITQLDASRHDAAHMHPVFLPDGDHFLYLVRNVKVEDSGVYVRSLKTGVERLLLRSAISAVVAPPNYVLFTQGRTTLAQPIDLKTFTLVGSPLPVADQVDLNESRGRASLAASDNGFLVYRSARNAEMNLTWFDRSGSRIGSIGDSAVYQGVNIASSGKQVVAHRHEEPGGDLFVLDAQTGASRRLTFEPEEHGRSAVWSPDGNMIAFAKTKAGHTSIVEKIASGASTEQTVLVLPDADVNPVSWSTDGKYLLYEYQDSKSGTTLWALPTFGDRKPIPVTSPQSAARHGQFSPDGGWIAYRSNASGRPEVYVEPFPPTGAKWQLSARGGDYPRWRGDGKEVYFIALDRKLMAVEVHAQGKDFENGIAQALFQTRISYGPGVAHIPYAAAADGQRFLITTLNERDAGTAPVVVLVNWTAIFRR